MHLWSQALPLVINNWFVCCSIDERSESMGIPFFFSFRHLLRKGVWRLLWEILSLSWTSMELTDDRF